MGKGRKKGIRKSSLIRTAPYPNKEMMAGYLHRAKSLEREEDYANALALRFHNNVRLNGTANAVCPKPRADALEKLRELRDYVPEEKHIVLNRTKEQVVKVFFSGAGAYERAFLMLEDGVNMCLKRSVVYSSRRRAVEQFQRNQRDLSKITWIRRVEFEELVLADPSSASLPQEA